MLCTCGTAKHITHENGNIDVEIPFTGDRYHAYGFIAHIPVTVAALPRKLATGFIGSVDDLVACLEARPHIACPRTCMGSGSGSGSGRGRGCGSTKTPVEPKGEY